MDAIEEMNRDQLETLFYAGHYTPDQHYKFLLEIKRKEIAEDLTIERGKYGQWIVSAVIGEHLETRQYYDYTQDEAQENFINQFTRSEQEQAARPDYRPTQPLTGSKPKLRTIGARTPKKSK